MNSRFSQEPEAVSLEPNTCLDGEQSGMSSGTPTAKKSSKRGYKTVFCTMRRSSGTFESLSVADAPNAIAEWLMSLPPDSRAPRSHVQGNSVEHQTQETCGPKPCAVYKKSDPNLSFSKMSLVSSPIDPSLAYAAGLIDGEGHIGIQSNKKQSHFYVEVTVGMSIKAMPILLEMKRRFGGTVTKSRQATEDWEAAAKWRTGGADALSFIAEIKPFLLLKAPQAAIVMEMMAMVQQMDSHPNGTKIWKESHRIQASKMKARMHDLNKKGPNAHHAEGDWYKPDPDLFGIWEPFLATFAKAGMTVDGAYYPQPKWERRIAATGCGSWQTPTAKDSTQRAYQYSRGDKTKPTPTLAGQARGYWPTPDTQNHRDGTKRRAEAKGSHAVSLHHAVMYPTPRAEDARCAGGHRGQLDSLHAMAKELWQTPTVADATGSRGSKGAARPDEGGLAKQVKLWPTPTARLGDARGAQAKRYDDPRRSNDLDDAVAKAERWPIPRANDWKETYDSETANVPVNGYLGRAVAPTKTGGSLDPGFVEYLQGFPQGWTSLEPLGMRKFRLWLQQHGTYSQRLSK